MDEDDVTLTIDLGTIILVAEILKEERGCSELPVDDASAAIKRAVSRLKGAGVQTTEEEET